MKNISQAFKENIVSFARELDSIITYYVDDEEKTLTSEEINSISLHYQGGLLKSVMKQLDLDVNVELKRETIVKLEFGVKVGDDYEYINYGYFIVNEVEKQEDTDSYKVICYDEMLYSMVDYENLNISYPITINDYLKTIANYMGLTFKNDGEEFPNYNKTIPSELYLNYEGASLDFKFRDVLDDLAEVTASTICVEGRYLVLKYIEETNDTIDEDFMKNVNVKFGEKFGPINSIVLSRSAESDNIYIQDEESIEENGLCEIKIIDNQIMNDNNRSDFLPDILEKLDGIEYYVNDFSSVGICYYDLCDRYTITIGDTDYTCVMFNDEINITQGLEENVYTEKPEETNTDYSKADKKDRETYIIVNKQEEKINSVVSTTNNLTSSIENNREEINNLTEKAIELEGDILNVEQNLRTELEQTNDTFDFRFTNITDIVTQLGDEITNIETSREKYIRFVNGVIHIGIVDDPFEVTISNEKMSFLQEGTEIAYISNSKLFIKEAHVGTDENGNVVGKMRIGDFAFYPRENGSLSFGKVGE